MTDKERVRYMRLVLFFDLPVETPKQRKDYRLFRKFLLKDGFLPLQQSVYAKLVVNDGVASWRDCPCSQTSTAGGIGADPQGYGNSVFDYGVHNGEASGL